MRAYNEDIILLYISQSGILARTNWFRMSDRGVCTCTKHRSLCCPAVGICTAASKHMTRPAMKATYLHEAQLTV